MNCGIYVITSPSGKQYVGSAINFTKRWQAHRLTLRKGTHHCIGLQRAANKYGVDALEFSVILVCERPMLVMYEQAALDSMKPSYNRCLVAGSPLGLKRTPEARAKMAAAKLGNTFRRGKTLTEENKKKISETLKAKGNKIAPETRVKIVAAQKTEEYRTKMAESVRLSWIKRKADVQQRTN